ncbi:5085_t:CDS:1, partial [Acaulospora colombiana]
DSDKRQETKRYVTDEASRTTTDTVSQPLTSRRFVDWQLELSP